MTLESGVQFHVATAMFLFSTALSLLTLGFHPTSFLGLEDDHTPLRAAEVKTAWSYTFISPHILLA
jgi:hypothetical protein